MNRLLPLLAFLTFSPAFAQAPASPATERELFERALGSDYDQINVNFFVGRLPAAPLGPIPQVPSSRLVGSVSRVGSVPEASEAQSIHLDSSASPTQVHAAVHASLQALGWTPFPRRLGPSSMGGFQAAENADPAVYYRLEQQVRLTVQIRRVKTVTRVSLSLQRDRNLRQQLQAEQNRGMEYQTNLPALRPPSGMTVQPRGVSGGNGNWSSHASIQSSLTGKQILEAYGVQLKAAGWTLLGSHATGQVQMSVWRFIDQNKAEVTGVLTLRASTPGQYSVQLATLGFRT